MEDQGLFSEHIYSTSFQEEFKKGWNQQCDFKSTNFEIISSPFKVCRISNFLKQESFIDKLKNELENHNHKVKHNDLYQFKKTDDLYDASDDHIQALHRSFRKDLRSWLERNTDIKLNGNILMTSARYYDTDHLLCHDDRMDARRIAYILYLSKNWLENDGGTLDLFDTDENGSPANVAKSLVPEYNSFVFFEVTDDSYHQVAEVKSNDKCRWSINGWFLGSLKDCHLKVFRYEPAVDYVEPNPIEIKLSSWIFRNYLNPNIMEQIQNEVEIKSCIFLQNFLRRSAYQKIANDLTSRDINWRMVGPADIRRYEVADEQTLPKQLKAFFNMFKSITFFRLLQSLSGLDLMPDKKKTMTPRMTIEIQRWSAGCYTLLYNKSLLKNDWNYLKKTTVQLNDDTTASTSKSSTERDKNETVLDASETQQELKRKRSWSPSATKSSSPAEKSAKYDDQFDWNNVQNLPKNESDDSEASLSEDDKLSCSSSVNSKQYLLDVIIQFHTSNAEGASKTDSTIDFIDSEAGNTLVQFPAMDNHLALVYRSLAICRLQPYLNHFYDGYSYAFVCEYHE